ncbi:unnamed protein product [Absidia cylindrospora]
MYPNSRYSSRSPTRTPVGSGNSSTSGNINDNGNGSDGRYVYPDSRDSRGYYSSRGGASSPRPLSRSRSPPRRFSYNNYYGPPSSRNSYSSSHQGDLLHLVIIGAIVTINGLLMQVLVALIHTTHHQAITTLTILTIIVEALIRTIHPIAALMVEEVPLMFHCRSISSHPPSSSSTSSSPTSSGPGQYPTADRGVRASVDSDAPLSYSNNGSNNNALLNRPSITSSSAPSPTLTSPSAISSVAPPTAPSQQQQHQPGYNAPPPIQKIEQSTTSSLPSSPTPPPIAHRPSTPVGRPSLPSASLQPRPSLSSSSSSTSSVATAAVVSGTTALGTPSGTRPSSPAPLAPTYRTPSMSSSTPSAYQSLPTGPMAGSSSSSPALVMPSLSSTSQGSGYFSYHQQPPPPPPPPLSAAASSSSSNYIPQGPSRYMHGSRPNTPSTHPHFNSQQPPAHHGSYSHHYQSPHHMGASSSTVPPLRERPIWAAEQEKEMERYQSEDRKLMEDEIKCLAAVRKGRFDLELGNWETSKLEHQLDLVQKQWKETGMEEIVQAELSARLPGGPPIGLGHQNQKVVHI